MPLIKSQPILYACSCWKNIPSRKEDKLRPEVLLYPPYKKYYNTCPNTYDILKRLPWVGLFNEGFLSRPAFPAKFNLYAMSRLFLFTHIIL